MLPGLKAGFTLDARLEADSEQVMWLGLCELRVMNDRRWPWLLLAALFLGQWREPLVAAAPLPLLTALLMRRRPA